MEKITESLEELKESAIFEKLEKEFYLNNKRKGMLDTIQEKIVSRKLLVFLTATGLFAWHGLDPDTWGLIAVIYIGGQSMIDAVKVWKGA